MKVATLKTWITLKHCKSLLDDGISSITDTYMKFVFAKKPKENNDNQLKPKTPCSAQSCASELLFMNIAEAEEDKLDYDCNEELQEIEKKNQLANEIDNFTKFLQSKEFFDKYFSSKQFWIKNGKKFSNLSKLTLILLNILASSSCVERYFSICGVVCQKRNSHSNDDLIISRCLLKANMPILKEINESCN